MIFNYRKFLKNQTFKHPIKINDGGLIVKAEGSATISNDDGTLINYELTEQKDDLVNLVYKNSVTFSELSNKGDTVGDATTSRDQLWITAFSKGGYRSDKIAKMQGESIGDDVGNVIYNRIGGAAPVELKVDKNNGIQGAIEDPTYIPLTPAYKMIGGEDDKIINNTGITIMKTYLRGGFLLLYFNSPILFSDSDTDIGYYFKALYTGQNQSYDSMDITISGAVSEKSWLNNTYKVTSLLSVSPDKTRFSGLRIRLEELPDNIANNTIYTFTVSDNVLVNTIKSYLVINRKIDTNYYSLVNLWNKPKKTFFGDSFNPGYISKKKFKKLLKDVAAKVNVDGIDVIAVPYLENLVELPELPATVGPHYSTVKIINADGTETTKHYVDTNYSFLKRQYKRGTSALTVNMALSVYTLGVSNLFTDDYEPATFSRAKVAGDYFIDFKKNPQKYLPQEVQEDPQLLDITKSALSPYDSSFRDVIASIYGPRNVLFDELMEIYNDILSNTKENSAGFSLDSFIPGDIDKNANLIFKNRVDDAILALQEQVNDLRSAMLAGSIISLGAAGAATAAAFAVTEDLQDDIRTLRKWRKKAHLFEYYTGESILGNGLSIGERNSDADPTEPLENRNLQRHLCRMLIPVDMGKKKSRRRVKNFFGKVVWEKYTHDLGVRWVEVYFVNAYVHELHRMAEKITGEQIPLNPEVNPLGWTLSSIGDKITRRQLIAGSIKGKITSESLIETTLVLSSPQNIVNAGTQIYFEIYDRSSTTKHPYHGMWDGIVLNETDIVFKVPPDISFKAENLPITNLTIRRIIKPYPPSQPSLEPRNCQIEYNVPDLPSDEAIRDVAFNSYGPLDQGKYAIRWNDFKKLEKYGITGGNTMTTEELAEAIKNMEQAEGTVPGFELFKSSSALIQDMRVGVDVFNKAAFLLTILESTFGKSRVSLIETVRSHEDQDVLQLGGPSSNFLSWHNYGIAVKINITGNDGISLIRDGSEDFFKLLNIAEGFTTAALNGSLGKPCNVVWCGRLKTGPNIFVWEFLPIGIGHKEAIKFRDAFYNQMDAFEAVTPIDVDTNGYVRDVPIVNNVTVPNDEADLDSGLEDFIDYLKSNSLVDGAMEIKVEEAEYILRNPSHFSRSSRIKEKKALYKSLGRQTVNRIPYVLKSSPAYKNATVVNGRHYVSPENIINYPIHRNLILKDIQEFLFLIQNKFKANGTDLAEGQRVIDWKNTNPISFNQLIMYNSLLGNFSVVKKLIAIDYLSSMDTLINIANADPVTFVRKFLGLKEYMNVRIYPDGLERDSGFISLYDGKISVSILQCRSIHPEGFSNMFGEKYADFTTIEFGQIQNGVFIPEFEKDPLTGIVTENKMDMIKSDKAVISGYDREGNIIVPPGITEIDGTVVPASDAYFLHVIIKDKILDMLKKMRESYETLKTEFLHDKFATSPNAKKMIENEFGAIFSQDLLSFDDLRDVYRKIEINKSGNNSIGDKKGAGGNTDVDVNDIADLNRDQSVYEKLISTTQLTGIQFSRNTKEKPTIEPLKRDSIETILKRFKGDNSPDVRDIL